MKQRLLYAFLMLFMVAGMARATVTITVKSTGGAPVTVTLDKEATVTDLATTHKGNVTLSADQKTVTLAQGYVAEVVINSTSATVANVMGRMEKLDISGNATLKTLNLNKENYVKELIVSGSALETLTCAGLELETLNLTDASALKTLDASDNKLSTSLTWPSTPVLEVVNLSGNLFTTLTVSSLTTLKELIVSRNLLTDLDASSLNYLAKLDLSDNKILKLSQNPGKSDCAITWGVQTLTILTSPKNETDANVGFRIPQLMMDAEITTDSKQAYSNVSWQVKDGTVYVEDNNKTAHQQTGAWSNEYRFYDTSTKEFVKGTYQCSFKTNGRDYKITDLNVWTAKFNLTGVSPTNATDFKVSIDGGTAVDVSSNPKVNQGAKLLFTLTPKDGYETATYTIEGMVPASSAIKPPYKGTSFECIVKGLYKSQDETVSPKISAVVLGKEHVISYESKTQIGGSFTVQKVSGTTTSDVAPDDHISTGDKLLVKIKPNTGYEFVLTINGLDKTSEVKKLGDGVDADYTYSEDIINTSYVNEKTITISVTFKNPEIKASVKVDGQNLSNSIKYIENNKVTLVDQDGTSQEIVDDSKINLVSNTTYQAIFVVTKSDPDVYRLKDITINGGKLVSVNKDAEEASNAMKYTVAFKVEASDVVISITTKKMQVVSIVPVVNDGSDGQKQTYDGKAKPVLFSTIPVNLEEHVKVTYVTDASSSVDMGTTLPVNAGKYKATLTFEETDYYIPDATNGKKADFKLEIEKAPLTIETLPTVTVNKAGAYEVSGGKVTFNKEEVKGAFAAAGTPLNPGISHTTEITFKPTLSADAANYEEAKATVNVLVNGSTLDLYKITLVALPSSYSIQWLNGNKPVDISKETFANGTVLTAIVSYPKGTKDVMLEKTSSNGKSDITKNDAKSVDGSLVYAVTMKEDTEFKVVAGTGNQYTIQFKNQNADYIGEPLSYDPEKGLIISDKDGHSVTWATIKNFVSVTYKDALGKTIAQPVDAGTYTVCVSIKENDIDGYVETIAEKAALVVNKIKPLVYKWPTASVIAKGQTLAQSDLTEGAANIPGTFVWKDSSLSFAIAGEYRRPVVFTPNEAYIKNYLSVETRGGESLDGDGIEQNEWVKFAVSDLQIITFSQMEGTITVTNQLGQNLLTGSAITEGDVLTIKVEPHEGLELKSLTVNGISNNGVYTVGTSSVAIAATYQPQVIDPEPSDPVIDPNSQYAVTLPKAGEVRGVAISKPGVNAVLKDKSFSFTVGALATDLSKIVVKVNGSELKSSSDGTYTIAKVSENTTVQISLANPTPLAVSIEKITKNQNGKVLGTVGVDGPADGICYFNDEITLVAYPESGVTFIGWSDDKDVKSQLRKLTLTKDITIKPLFSGIPTGIESIATTQIQGGKGYLLITGAGQANVTIVGMDGRIQRQPVSGDSRIELSSGVYGVILEEGTNVIRTKVIVK
ncbi:InlB B-repeat-containing protein [Parabacteroides sp.]